MQTPPLSSSQAPILRPASPAKPFSAPAHPRHVNPDRTPLGTNPTDLHALSIKDQAERISRCSFTFDLKGNKFNGIGRMNRDRRKFGGFRRQSPLAVAYRWLG